MSGGVYRLTLEGDDVELISDHVTVTSSCRGTVATYAGGGGDLLVLITHCDPDTFVDCLFSFEVQSL